MLSKTAKICLITALALPFAGAANAQYSSFYSIPGEWEPTIPSVPTGTPTVPPLPTPVVPPLPITVPTVTPTTPDYGATRLVVGLAPRTPNGAVSGLNVTTTEVDAVLTQAGAYLNFGNSYTRDLANAGFEDIRQAKAKLNAEVKRDLLATGDFKSIPYLEFDLNPLKLQISQTGTRIGAMIGDFSARGKVKASVPFCGTATGWFGFEGVRAGSEYDVYRGNLVNTSVDYTLNKLDAKCSTPWGQLVYWIADLFVDKKQLVRGAIDDAIDDGIRTVEAKELFALEDFLEGLKMYTTNLSSVPYVGTQLVQDADSAIDKAQDILSDPNFRGLGVVVDFKLSDMAENEISLIASHTPSRISHIEYIPRYILLTFKVAPNTERLDIFAQSRGSSGWRKVGSATGASAVIPQQDKGTKLVVIGRNRSFGDLYSAPSAPRTTTWDYSCYRSPTRPCPNFF